MLLLGTETGQLLLKQVGLSIGGLELLRVCGVVQIRPAGRVWSWTGNLGEHGHRVLVLPELFDILVHVFLVVHELSAALVELLLFIDHPLFYLFYTSVIFCG